MAYQSKYTGLQIDDILDSVEWKQGKIEDLASIRAGAQKGATALQSYTEKYTGTVTGIKINGVVKSGSGVIDLGTISTTETDPIFSASPAASITEAKKTEWDNKVDKVAGKQLSTEDFTTALKTKLEGLSNYDDTELSDAIETLRGDFDNIVSGDTTTAIKTFNEVIAFLDGLTDTQDLESIIASIEQQIAGKMDTLISGTNIKTINGESILGEGDITIEGGKVYEWKPIADENGNYNGSLTQEEFENIRDCDILTIYSYPAIKQSFEGYIIVQCVLGLEAIFINISPDLKYQGMTETVVIPTKTSELENDSDFVTTDGLKTINGESILGSGDITIQGGGSYDDSEIREAISQLSAITDDFNSDIANLYNIKQDTLESGTNIKTINGESILGSGDISISGGSGGGSSAYSEVNHGTSDTTFSLTPNTFHVWDEVSALTLTFGSETSGVANEFLFQFTSGVTATTLSLPSDLKWAEELVVEPNMIYQVSILKGLASMQSWSNSIELKDNFIDIQGNELVFQYPTTSELSIDVYGRTTGMPSSHVIVVPSGSSSYVASNLSTILYINSVSPSSDSTYTYTFQMS